MPPPRLKGDGRRAKDAKGTFFRLIRLLFQYYKKEIIFILACIAVTALAGTAPSIFVQTITAYINEGVDLAKSGIPGGEVFASLLPSILTEIGRAHV